MEYLHSSHKWTQVSFTLFHFLDFDFFFEIGSYCSPGWPSGHHVAQPALQLTGKPTHDSLRFILFRFFINGVCVRYNDICTMEHMWRSQDALVECFTFTWVPGIYLTLSGFQDKCPHSLSQPTSLHMTLCSFY